MKQETVAKKALKDLITFGYVGEADKDKVYEYLLQVFAAGCDETYVKPSQPRPIVQYSKKGRFIRFFPSITEAVKETGVLSGNIHRSLKKPKKAVGGGYLWKDATSRQITAYAKAKTESTKVESIQQEQENRVSKIASERSPQEFL